MLQISGEFFRRRSRFQLFRQYSLRVVPHNQQRAVPDGDGSGPSGELIADSQGKAAVQNGVPEGVVEAGEGNAPGLAVRAEDGRNVKLQAGRREWAGSQQMLCRRGKYR